MSLIRSVLFATLASGLLPTAARAAESYDSCTGYITSLPATVSSAGTWCLTQDLSTAVSSGAALTIASDNVVLDCNGFKLGGLAAGPGTVAHGVSGAMRYTTVRNCNIRGFAIGVYLAGSGQGHVIEDNRLDGNVGSGIRVAGDGSTVRRNSIRDTGKSSRTYIAQGIHTSGTVDVLDNLVSGVTAYVNDGPGYGSVYGIQSQGNNGGTIARNRIRGLNAGTASQAIAIHSNASARVGIQDNDLVGDGSHDQWGNRGITCDSVTSKAKGNVINGFEFSIDNCRDEGNSL